MRAWLYPLPLLLVPLAGSTAGHAQQTVAAVKAAPMDFRGRTIRLEGEVIEIQALSPRSERGTYRLIDATDRQGLLIRTSRLPETGGPFRIRARLAPEMLQEGTLLLEEMERSLARSELLPVAAALGGGGLLVALVCLVLYLRARRTERHLHLAPPMWLIPTGAGQPSRATRGPDGGVKFNYRLQYIEEERSAALERRKRRLLTVMALAGGVGVTGAGWVARLGLEDAARPSFVLLTAEEADAGGRNAPTVPRTDDTLRLGLVPRGGPAGEPSVRPAPPPPASARPGATLPRGSRRPRPTPSRTAPDTVPSGGPPGATVPEEPLDIVPPPPPRPDLEPLRPAATAELMTGVDRLVGAINAGQSGAGLLYLLSATEPRRRERFLGFVRQASPRVSVSRTDPVTLSPDAATVSVSLLFQWLAESGVVRRQAVRFALEARREGSRWILTETRLLENFP